MPDLPFITSDTVVGDTPASWATSLTVDAMVSDPLVGHKLSVQLCMACRAPKPQRCKNTNPCIHAPMRRRVLQFVTIILLNVLSPTKNIHAPHGFVPGALQHAMTLQKIR
jgi:hypothetical protein